MDENIDTMHSYAYSITVKGFTCGNLTYLVKPMMVTHTNDRLPCHRHRLVVCCFININQNKMHMLLSGDTLL